MPPCSQLLCDLFEAKPEHSMHHDLPLNAWQISKRKICIGRASDRTSGNFLLVLSPLGLEDKAEEGPLTLPAGDRGKDEENHTHSSPQQPADGYWHSLVFRLPALVPFRDPQGCFSSGTQCNAQKSASAFAKSQTWC